MMRRRYILSPVLAAMLSLGGYQAPVGAQAERHQMPTMREMAAMPSMLRLEETHGKEFEVAFLSEMIEHHAGAVEMSQMALPKLRRPEVKEAARKVVTAQKREIAQMSSWLQAWYRQKPDRELRARMKQDMAPMAAAFRTACQKACDLAFLSHMSMHHQLAIDMAQLALEKSTHPPLRELARKIITDQAAEIARFDAWQDVGHRHSPASRQ